MPHIPDHILDHIRTVLETAADQVERSVARGWDRPEHHAGFLRAKQEIMKYLEHEGRL